MFLYTRNVTFFTFIFSVLLSKLFSHPKLVIYSVLKQCEQDQLVSETPAELNYTVYSFACTMLAIGIF